MKRITHLLLLALCLSVGPATLAAAQVAPFSTDLATMHVALAVATVPETPALVTAAADVELAHVNEAVELPPVTSWNPADWFKDALALAGVIAALVALIKANFLKNLQGLQTVGLSFALGIAISLLGTIDLPVIGRVNELTGMAAIMFGLNAAVFASGGWDAIKSLLLAAFGGKSPGQAEAST